MHVHDEFRQELLALGQGLCIIEDDAPYVERLGTRFDLGTHIDWAKARDVEELKAPPERASYGSGGDSPFNLQRHAPAVRAFCRHCVQKWGIDVKTDVVVVFDSAPFAAACTLEFAVEHCNVLFDHPQYAYIIPSDAAWCFCYTFGDDVIFGRAPATAGG